VRMERVRDCTPDMVIGVKEENTLQDVEALSAFAPVWMADIITLENAYVFIDRLGEMFNVQERSLALRLEIEAAMQAAQGTFSGSCAYLIWKDPYMVAARSTFINSGLEHLGLSNVFHNQERYPVVTLENLRERAPDHVFLSTEPFAFQRQHVEELQALLPDSRVQLIDGKYLSWFGSSMLQSAKNLQDFLHH
jgi:ABC-type Fe3+-hydroxamate transport system substrate-binding protein